MLVWVAGFEPAASCVQGGPSTRLTVHPAKNNWCPRGESNSQNSASKADTYASSVTGAWITKKTNSPPFRLCPHAMGHARPARTPSTSLHREVAIPCTSRQAVHAALPWRWCEDTPEMVFLLKRGHCAGVMSGKAPQQLVKEHRWPAARSPQTLKPRTKRKGPEPCGARASAKRAWKGMNAPMRRALHPVANDPHRGHVHTNQPPDTAAGARRHAGPSQRRARARGPVRVGGW